jgi:sulfate adenylyltransferase subunit 1 (EFTu-like GTPase family)
MSALRGDMVVERGAHLGWYAGPTLLEMLESVDVATVDTALPLRFPVQFVSRGETRGYLGRVAAGRVRPGAEITVLPSGRRTRVKSIRVLDAGLGIAVAGDSVALHFEDDLDVSRGDMIVDAGQPPRTAKAFEAKLCWLSNEPLAPQGRYLLRHTTRTVKAKVASINYRIDVHTLDRKPLEGDVRMNDIVHAALIVQQPIFVDSYAANRATGSFILIDEATNQTVAAGMIE